MASLNKVLLIGNLTRDPELRYTSGGAAVCGFGLAMNRRFNTASGEQREEACFVDVDIWGKQGESCKNYLRKGSPVFIEGRLRMDSWQDRETGKTRSRLTVTAERVQFLSSPRGEFADGGGGYEEQGGGYPDQGGGYEEQGGGYQQRGYQQQGGGRPQPRGGGYQQQGQGGGYRQQQPARAPQQAFGPPSGQQQGGPPPPQMPAFEQPNDEADALDDIPF